MRELKQSATTVLKLGPFLDSTDGDTVEAGITLVQADIRLSKNGGDFAQKGNASSSVYDEAGFYNSTVSVVDTGTLGSLKVAVHRTGSLAVWHDYSVVDKNYWASKYSSDILDVNTIQVGGTVQTALDINDILTDTAELQTDDIPGRLDTLSASVAVIDGNVDLTLADTNELQTDDIPGRIDTLSGTLTTILADTGELQTDDIPGRLNTISGSVTVIDTAISNIQGTGFASATSSLAAIRTRGDIAWLTGAGGSSPTVEQIRTEMDDNSSKLAAIIIDTSATIQGRLDTLSASVFAIPTTAMRGTDGVSLVIPDVAGVVPGRLNTMSSSISAIPTTPMRGTDNVSLVIPDAAGVVDLRLNTISSTLAVIEADTNELQGDDIPSRLDTLSGSVTVINTSVAAIQIDTSSTIPGLVNGLNDLSAANVNAEVLDVMTIDTHVEHGQGLPTSTTSFGSMIRHIYKLAINKKRQTATVTTVYNNAGTVVDMKRTTAGSSSTATIGAWESGPE